MNLPLDRWHLFIVTPFPLLSFPARGAWVFVYTDPNHHARLQNSRSILLRIQVRANSQTEGRVPYGREAILGDPGAVSRVGRKGATKVFMYGRKSPWVPTLTELFPKIQADASSWLGTKNALYYCAQSANSFSWVLFVGSYTTAIARFVHKACANKGNFYFLLS